MMKLYQMMNAFNQIYIFLYSCSDQMEVVCTDGGVAQW